MSPMARDPKELCARPYDLGPEGGAEPDLIYCGLRAGHSGPHIAMVWWFDDAGLNSEPWRKGPAT